MESDAAWGGFIVILIISLSIIGANAIIKFAEGKHECNENKDCVSNSYCGSDFECHEFPTRPAQTNWIIPSLIVSACIIVGAVIVRNKTTN